jgi:protein-tyrosine phosphatase
MGKLDAHEIVPRLWQGGDPPFGRALRDHGFDIVVLCARELQYPAVYFQDIEVLHAPNDDSVSMPLDRLKLGLAVKTAKMLARQIKAGKKCLVTCKAGLNRSGLVTALTLHMLFGWDGQTCIDAIRAVRSSRKYPDLRPLCNPQFEECLLQLPRRGQHEDP